MDPAVAATCGPVNRRKRPDPPEDHTRTRVTRLAALGGGTGLPAVLEGLRGTLEASADPDALTAIVTVTDEGGSSGLLRKALGVLPPGDIRNCLIALADDRCPYKELLQHRLGKDEHAIGNLLLTALSQVHGDFGAALRDVEQLLQTRGRVIPSTAETVRLRAEMESGALLTGETEVVGTHSKIRRLSLSPSPRPVPEALRALINADGIVVGPGSLYTSVLPNLLVEGVAGTIYGADGVRIYIANLMTEPGETDGYTLDDHLRAIRTHTGYDLFDFVLVNRRPIEPRILGEYAKRGSEPVAVDGPLEHAGPAAVVEWSLAVEWGTRKIRHHPPSLASVIRTLVAGGRRTAAHVA